MSPDDRAVLVTGATGFIGRALVTRLAGAGRRVIAVSRGSAPAWAAGVECRVADLASGDGVTPELFEGVGGVFHCAGEIKRPEAMHALHVAGTQRLLRALEAAAPPAPLRWTQLSSVGAYGPPATPGARRQIDERSPELPAGPYEVSKTAGDQLVRQASADGLVSCAILRPSAVIGRGMPNASLPGLIALVRRGWYFHVGPADAVANYVHIDDVVDALIRCGTDPRAAGETFNLSSDCLWTALIDRIARLSGVRPPRARVPLWLARGAARVASLVPGHAVSPARVEVLAGRTRYPAGRIESALGFRFSQPMPDAISDVMAARS